MRLRMRDGKVNGRRQQCHGGELRFRGGGEKGGVYVWGGGGGRVGRKGGFVGKSERERGE